MSSEVFQAITGRKSIRAYTDAPVAREDLQRILTAGLHAPSARNLQPWHVVTVTDAALLAEMNAAYVAHLRSLPGWGDAVAEDSSVYYNAPAVIFIAGDSASQFNGFDCGLLTQSMALQAYALGLGTCIVAMWGMLLNDEAGKPYRERLGIPDGYRVWAGLSVGHPAVDPDAKPRDAAKFGGDVLPA